MTDQVLSVIYSIISFLTMWLQV